MHGPDVGGGFTPGGVGGVCLPQDENGSRARCVAIFLLSHRDEVVPEDQSGGYEEARRPRYRLILGSRVNGADNTRALASFLRSAEVVIGWCSSLRQQIRLISPRAEDGFYTNHPEMKTAAKRRQRGSSIPARPRHRLIKDELRGFN